MLTERIGSYPGSAEVATSPKEAFSNLTREQWQRVVHRVNDKLARFQAWWCAAPDSPFETWDDAISHVVHTHLTARLSYPGVDNEYINPVLGYSASLRRKGELEPAENGILPPKVYKAGLALSALGVGMLVGARVAPELGHTVHALLDHHYSHFHLSHGVDLAPGYAEASGVDNPPPVVTGLSVRYDHSPEAAAMAASWADEDGNVPYPFVITVVAKDPIDLVDAEACDLTGVRLFVSPLDGAWFGTWDSQGWIGGIVTGGPRWCQLAMDPHEPSIQAGGEEASPPTNGQYFLGRYPCVTIRAVAYSEDGQASEPVFARPDSCESKNRGNVSVRWDQPGFARLGVRNPDGTVEWLQAVPIQRIAKTEDGTLETGQYGAHFDHVPDDGRLIIGLWFDGEGGKAAGVFEPGVDDWPVQPHEAGVVLKDLTPDQLASLR